MRTLRLIYPDWASGGLTTYALGARLMAAILPESDPVDTVTVPLPPAALSDRLEPVVTRGVARRELVAGGIRAARALLEAYAPERVVTAGGSCIVSQAPFDYLHGRWPEAGILWIDAHPDVSTPEDGYPNAHAMVLGNLLGAGDPELAALNRNGAFPPERVLYAGLQGLLEHQRAFLERAGVNVFVQNERFVTPDEVRAFASRHPQLLVHLDIDVLDPARMHDTYFANPALTGDGSGGGRMSFEELEAILAAAFEASDVVGFSVAEYLPFEAERLQRIFAGLPIFAREK